MRGEIEEFFERYRRALEQGDLETLVASYRMPLPIVRPDRTATIDDPATLRLEIERVLDTYRWAGMETVAIGNYRRDAFEPGMHIVSLSWRPLNASGDALATIDVTYAIRCASGGARIASIIAHNEERRREQLLQELGPRNGGAPPIRCADTKLGA